MNVAAKTIKLAVFMHGAEGMAPISVPCCSAQFNHSIDDLPNCVVNVQLNNEQLKSVGLDLSAFTKLSKDTQEYLVNQFRVKLDMEIIAEDGDGRRLSFAGFMSNPTFAVMAGELMLNYTIIHKAVGMQGFNAGIYNFCDYYGHADKTVQKTGVQDTDVSLHFTSGDEDCLADRTNALLVNLGSYYEHKVDKQTGAADVLLPYHNINKLAYSNFIEPVLTKSFASTIIPYTGDKPGRVIGQHMSNVINQELINVFMSTESFLAAVPAICAMFKFQFNANWAGEAWFEHIRTHQITDGRFIKVPQESLRFNLSSAYELPLLKVFVAIPQGAGYYSYKDYLPNGSPIFQELTPAQSAQTIKTLPSLFVAPQGLETNQFIQYPTFDPKPSDLGTYILVSPPSWVSTDVTLYQAQTDLIDTASFQPGAALTADRLREQAATNAFQERSNLLLWIAKRTFDEYFLKSAMASITIPFCADIQVGTTYEVQDMQGHPLFTGYLAHCTHSISQGRQEANARTDLIFSHVTAAGVEFNRIKANSQDPARHVIPNYVQPAAALALPKQVTNPLDSVLAKYQNMKTLDFSSLKLP